VAAVVAAAVAAAGQARAGARPAEEVTVAALRRDPGAAARARAAVLEGDLVDLEVEAVVARAAARRAMAAAVE
jgi:hypothetical protein